MLEKTKMYLGLKQSAAKTLLLHLFCFIDIWKIFERSQL